MEFFLLNFQWYDLDRDRGTVRSWRANLVWSRLHRRYRAAGLAEFWMLIDMCLYRNGGHIRASWYFIQWLTIRPAYSIVPWGCNFHWLRALINFSILPESGRRRFSRHILSITVDFVALPQRFWWRYGLYRIGMGLVVSSYNFSRAGCRYQIPLSVTSRLGVYSGFMMIVTGVIIHRYLVRS